MSAMSGVEQRSRVARGVPAGGQFAVQARSEPEVSLGSARRGKDTSGEQMFVLDVSAETFGGLPEDPGGRWWVWVERADGTMTAVGPIGDEATAGWALDDSELVDSLCQEDCVDAFTSQVQPPDSQRLETFTLESDDERADVERDLAVYTELRDALAAL